MKLFKDLYNYRELLKSNVKKEIRGKYKGSFLGVLWSFVYPLLTTLVYALVFPYLLRGSNYEHYTTFLIIGILPWNWFTTCIAQGTFTILGNAGIIKKVYFPREILPISIVTSGLVNFLITCLVMGVFLICSGIGFSFNLLYLPLIILAQFLLQLGIIFITCSINVYIRDLEYIVNFIVMMLFYATPILYSSEMFAGTKLQFLMEVNPMAVIVNCYRDVLYWKNPPHLISLLVVIGASLLLCIIGLFIFRKLSKGFAEEV